MRHRHNPHIVMHEVRQRAEETLATFAQLGLIILRFFSLHASKSQL